MKPSRVAELDALRGLAAIAIVVFHLNPAAFAVGWTGVDLFFVLSGYLITAIILDHGHSPRFLLTFYARRGLRIWPIYYLTLLFLVAINSRVAHPESLASLPYYLTYTQNLPLYWKGSAPSLKAFDHSWTLALEEQFYLIWPGLVLLGRRKRIIPLCLGAIVLAVVAREGGYLSRSPFSERILIARCDGFALGGLLAATLGNPSVARFASPKARRGVWLAALGGTGYIAWGVLEGGNGFLGLPTPARPSTTILAVGVMYCGLVGLVAIYAGSLALAPLRWRVLVYLGQISYGIYLYHYVIFWLIDGGKFVQNPSWTIRAEKVGLTLIVASASWHLIERPILRWKDRIGYA